MVSSAIRPKAGLRFDGYRDRIAAPRPDHTQIIASSDGLDWQGLRLEVGTNFGCDIDEVMVDGHFIGMQLNDQPLAIGTRSADQWSETVMPQYSLWIHPEGRPFSAHHSRRSRWAGVVIDGAYLDSVMGQHHELRACYVVKDQILSHSLSALVSQISDSDPQIVRNATLSASLIHSFVLALGSRHGVPAPPLPHNGGIAPRQIRSLRIWLEENIGSALRVDAMAARVGLSVAHFAREFKRSTGMTPWNYVMELRLNLAYKLLLQGGSAKDIAYRCGFSDQSHLCRAVRAHFGVSPRELAARSNSTIEAEGSV